jgi:hypothetical protein
MSNEQKHAFLGLARQFVLSDWRYALQEWDRYDMMKAEMGLPADTPLSDAPFEALIKPFVSRRDRATVLLELISLGYADRNYAPNESAFIQGLAAAFEVPDADLYAMQDWARRHAELMHEANMFFTE